MKALDCDDVTRGQPLPLGASVRRNGVNFAVFARHATGAQLLLFEPKDLSRPVRGLDRDFECHRTGDIWHVGLTGIGPGWAYTWRMTGPYTPEEGYRYDPRRMLLDPHAMALVGTSGKTEALPT
jgi:isoamylase